MDNTLNKVVTDVWFVNKVDSTVISFYKDTCMERMRKRALAETPAEAVEEFCNCKLQDEAQGGKMEKLWIAVGYIFFHLTPWNLQSGIISSHSMSGGAGVHT